MNEKRKRRVTDMDLKLIKIITSHYWIKEE